MRHYYLISSLMQSSLTSIQYTDELYTLESMGYESLYLICTKGHCLCVYPMGVKELRPEGWCILRSDWIWCILCGVMLWVVWAKNFLRTSVWRQRLFFIFNAECIHDLYQNHKQTPKHLLFVVVHSSPLDGY